MILNFKKLIQIKTYDTDKCKKECIYLMEQYFKGKGDLKSQHDRIITFYSQI